MAVYQTKQTGGIEWCNTAGTGHPNINVVENFNPNLPTDFFRWIPQGLFQDLRDVTNESGIPIIDQVSGYTIYKSANVCGLSIQYKYFTRL